jgi:inosine-uridine nucleoside N-ribohydrolase
MKRKVILDVDTGFDDAIALLVAGHHPQLELVAVTVAHGNAPLAVTLDNTLRLMAAGGLAHVPVYAGAERALLSAPPKLWEIQTAVLPLPPTNLQPAAWTITPAPMVPRLPTCPLGRRPIWHWPCGSSLRLPRGCRGW